MDYFFPSIKNVLNILRIILHGTIIDNIFIKSAKNMHDLARSWQEFQGKS